MHHKIQFCLLCLKVDEIPPMLVLDHYHYYPIVQTNTKLTTYMITPRNPFLTTLFRDCILVKNTAKWKSPPSRMAWGISVFKQRMTNFIAICYFFIRNIRTNSATALRIKQNSKDVICKKITQWTNTAQKKQKTHKKNKR